MDRRTAGLTAGTLAALAACVLVALDPAPGGLGDAVLVLAGIACGTLIWRAGRSHGTRLRGWRLFALAPLSTATGAIVAAALPGLAPLQSVGLRLLFMVPAYVLSAAGALTLVDPARLRTGGRRMAVELALFSTACLVVVPFFYIGLDGHTADVPAAQLVMMAAAVLVTSANLVAGLVLLGAIEPARQKVALLLLAGFALLTAGRGLSTAAFLSGAGGVADVARFLVVGGMAAVVFAAFADPGRTRTPDDRPRFARTSDLGHVLPHVAMVVAMAAVAAHVLVAQPPQPLVVAGALTCGALSCLHRWVSARGERRTAAALRRSEAYFRSLVSSSGDAVVLLDGALRLTWASAALDSVLGDGAGQALAGRPLLDLLHDDDVPAVSAALLASSGGSARDDLLVLRLPHTDGTWRRLEAAVSDLRGDPVVGAVVLHCRDVTERHAHEELLRSIAYTDPMTGMPNRAALERAVTELAAHPDGGVALLLIEIDGLVEAREVASMDTVSSVITQVGRRLRATVRDEDLVARLGVGVFAVLAREEGAEADQLADRCLAVVDQPLLTDEGVIELSAAAGVASLEPGDTVNAVLARAEVGIRTARTAGAGTAARYTDELGEAAARLERLRADLPQARGRDQLQLKLAPIVSLAEQRVAGVEARLCWRHPVLGDIAGTEFQPIAERTGVVADIGRWVLEEAMRATAALPSAGAPLRLGVDVPAAWAAGGTLLGDVEAALRRTGFTPERLVLEVAEETVLAGDERVRLDLTALRLMGVHVALDDFGAGEMSLSSLTRLPIDILKLDRSFITRVDRDEQRRALYESVVGIGRALQLDVVATGVETPAQLAAVQAFGAGFAQGFLLSRPMPPEDLADALAARGGALWPGLIGSR